MAVRPGISCSVNCGVGAMPGVSEAVASQKQPASRRAGRHTFQRREKRMAVINTPMKNGVYLNQ